jgi:putative zinc finger/helix-turn-helix YgiT family protein
MRCPNCHAKVLFKKTNKRLEFRGVEISVPVEHYRCSTCGIEYGTVDQTANIQNAIAEAYRKKVGLLTGKEIVEERTKQGLTQNDLAKRMNVGIASVKRWETGSIQSKSMDQALHMALTGQIFGDSCAGNRLISLARIKAVLNAFESALGRSLLKEGDKLLYSAKYLWYADMLNFRETGEGLTGATYAALPQGPQLNNYRDLIDEINNADEKNAEPLNKQEKRIITKVARKFPKNRDVYNAVHKEKVWEEKPKGATIPYSDSERLSQI